MVVNNLLWFLPSVYDSGSAEVRAFIAHGFTPPQRAGLSAKASSRAVLAVLALPQTVNVPPPETVDVVEFYNAGLDHYFITAFPDEIAKLDNGTFVGWARTGQSFRAYASAAPVAPDAVRSAVRTACLRGSEYPFLFGEPGRMLHYALESLWGMGARSERSIRNGFARSGDRRVSIW
jgi:hypothetical protein